LDRALLGGFADLVQAAGSGPVADVGCGSGRVTAHLSGLGLSVFGAVRRPVHAPISARPDTRRPLDVTVRSARSAGMWIPDHVPGDRAGTGSRARLL